MMAARAMQNAVNGPRPNQFTSTLMTRRRPASRVPRAIWTPRSRLIRSSVLRAARRAQRQRGAGLQRALGDAQLRAAPRSTVERELEEAVAQLQALRDLPPESVAVAPTKPVAIASASAESPLFAPASFSVPRFASQSGLDLLVTGTIEEIEGFLFIEAAAFDTAACGGSELTATSAGSTATRAGVSSRDSPPSIARSMRRAAWPAAVTATTEEKSRR